ncbi:MAG: AAA family ATPase [Planctomycetota bacterium]|jgi:MoxR-like ATPase
MTPDEAGRILEQTESAVCKVVLGQPQPVRETLTTLVAGGHALIEGVPGTAKTLLVRVLARCFDCRFQRIQFTPDLMPADITGVGVPEADGSGFSFREGPVFTDFLLADEINRAPAKTQAALLEAMQERRVTADGEGHSLGDLFTVFATQNPVEFEGTYRLPEAELDRFLMKVTIDYPAPEDEERILDLHRSGFDADREDTFDVSPVGDEATLRSLREATRAITVEDSLVRYIREIVGTTREAAALSMGAGPRGSVALLRAAQASALFDGRDFAVPDDVKSAAPAVLRHRVILQPEYEMEGVTTDAVVREILNKVESAR